MGFIRANDNRAAAPESVRRATQNVFEVFYFYLVVARKQILNFVVHIWLVFGEVNAFVQVVLTLLVRERQLAPTCILSKVPADKF